MDLNMDTPIIATIDGVEYMARVYWNDGTTVRARVTWQSRIVLPILNEVEFNLADASKLNVRVNDMTEKQLKKWLRTV